MPHAACSIPLAAVLLFVRQPCLHCQCTQRRILSWNCVGCQHPHPAEVRPTLPCLHCSGLPNHLLALPPAPCLLMCRLEEQRRQLAPEVARWRQYEDEQRRYTRRKVQAGGAFGK